MDNRLRIVNYLGKHAGRSFTMYELSKAVGVPYATFYRTLRGMDELVNVQTVGKARVVSLNSGNSLVKSYLAISSDEEKKEFLRKQPILSKIASELNTTNIVVLFGSYAKGTATVKSDIDMLIINRKGERSLSFSKYETLFGKKINPLFVSKREFERMLLDKEENVGKQALNGHIVLNNPEGFWEVVLHG